MASSINASTSGGGGIITTADATGILQLQSAGTATVTVGTAGGVGIGTTTTTNAKLTVNANTVLPATAPLVGTNLWVTGADAANNRITLDAFGGVPVVSFRASAGTAAAPTASLANVQIGNISGSGYGATGYSSGARANLVFCAAENWTDTAQGTYQTFLTTATGTTTNTERMRIDDFGNVTLQKNISVGGATPTTSGSGITFPATQSASSDANTLDDYEEGTWTPADASGAGLSITFNNAKYTKIGNLVYVRCSTIIYPATASGVGASISGLPFTNGFGDVGGVTISSSASANRILVLGNNTSIAFYGSSTLSGSTNISLSGLSIYGFSAVYSLA